MGNRARPVRRTRATRRLGINGAPRTVPGVPASDNDGSYVGLPDVRHFSSSHNTYIMAPTCPYSDAWEISRFVLVLFINYSI